MRAHEVTSTDSIRDKQTFCRAKGEIVAVRTRQYDQFNPNYDYFILLSSSL